MAWPACIELTDVDEEFDELRELGVITTPFDTST